MKLIISAIGSLFIFSVACSQQNQSSRYALANGRMPDIAKDKSNTLHIVYGSGDSIMYVSGNGKAFTTPSVVAVLPKLAASATRGPQIAATSNGLIVTACTGDGNIYAYKKAGRDTWTKATRLNDAETAKEGLMDLSADGLHAFAVWLSAKKSEGQEVYGVSSADGGTTWSKNRPVYASPDGTVCECCKPSAVVQGNRVYVMFRNWLRGSRDLYVAQSADGGATFGGTQKAGTGSWQLNGCPMDGGGLAVNKRGEVQTVWRREGTIYAAAPGIPEKKIGEGKGCTLETVNGKNIYAWTENEKVIVLKPDGQKMAIGKGSGPVLKALDDAHVVCVWENEKQIHSMLIQL